KLTNTTVSGNSAGVGSGLGVISGNGGGIHAPNGTILNCTIVENFATGGGGGLYGGGGPDGPHIKNTIIADNLIQLLSFGKDVDLFVVSEGHNLIGDASFSSGFGAVGDQLGTTNNPLDPLLGPLQNNGGPTKTHALLAGSPAIDAGDNSGAPATDQPGLARARGGDGNGSKIVDIGAFEL